MSDIKDCTHPRFRAQIAMRRVAGTPRYVVEISVMCKLCNRFMKFLNLPNDGTHRFPHTDEDGIAVSLPAEFASAEALFKED